jgi:hypothetical protein
MASPAGPAPAHTKAKERRIKSIAVVFLRQASIMAGEVIMKYKTCTTAVAALALFVFASLPAHAAQQMTVKTGYLTCQEASGWGFIIGSSHKIRCTYSSKNHPHEHYTGTISKFGADIGYLKSAVILWAVAAPTTELGPGALAGHYAGAQASLALGVGAGANVLVGGFKKSIALQPVSVEGQNGLNVAAGIGAMSLHYEGSRP